jgi:hypothetical protein
MLGPRPINRPPIPPIMREYAVSTTDLGPEFGTSADCMYIASHDDYRGGCSSFRSAATGLALGLAGAVAATRLLSTMLFAVKPTDPLTYASVIALLALVSLAATWIPAHRAMRLDPLAALRQE